jgi:hypothetical protein
MDNPLKYFSELRDPRVNAAWDNPYLLKLLGI